eukprot:3131527-Pyramimonas_sp.AAC.1
MVDGGDKYDAMMLVMRILIIRFFSAMNNGDADRKYDCSGGDDGDDEYDADAAGVADDADDQIRTHQRRRRPSHVFECLQDRATPELQFAIRDRASRDWQLLT